MADPIATEFRPLVLTATFCGLRLGELPPSVAAISASFTAG